MDRLRRVARINLVPTRIDPREDVRDLLLGQVVDKVVLLRNYHRQGIGTHSELDRRATVRRTGSLLFVLDRTRCVGNIALCSLTEALEASTCTNTINRHLALVAILVEELSHPLGEREDRRGASDDDIASHRSRINLR